jgi:glycyl-tRNA synthetase beta chain
MFSLGLAPSGSKDPFALRRAAHGVIKILAESTLPFTPAQVERLAVQESERASNAGRGDALSVFLKERLSFYLREVCGYSYDVVNAVLATELATVPDAMARARALTEVRGSDDLLAVSAAFKRIKNILRQAEEKGEGGGVETKIAAADLVEPAEQRLHSEAMQLAPQVEALRAKQQYSQALERIAALRPAVDAFFDSVMVMAPEANLRRNRLALIASVLSNFSRIADFSEMGAAGQTTRSTQA